MTEYVLRISTRDPARPLADTLLIEFGINTENARGFIEAVQGVAGMLQTLKTPEAAAEYLRNHAALANAKILTKEK